MALPDRKDGKAIAGNKQRQGKKGNRDKGASAPKSRIAYIPAATRPDPKAPGGEQHLIRAFGDIEGNVELQKFVLERISAEEADTTIFIGDIVDPDYNGARNIDFLDRFACLVTFEGKTRTDDYDPSDALESYKRLLGTLAPAPGADLSDKGVWQYSKFNYRTCWYKSTRLVGYEGGEALPQTVFVLGNKEVQLVFDIYNDLLARRGQGYRSQCTLTAEQLEWLYDYVNHCVDYVVRGDRVFLHNYANHRFIHGRHYVVGHCKGVREKERVTYIDTSRERHRDRFMFFFLDELGPQ